MSSENGEKNIKEDHDHLTAIIKGVHKHLRREFRADNHNHEKVWQQHSENQPCLQLYADAMYRLATEHWSVYPDTRIDWCKRVAIEYFLQGGLEKALQKDAKRKFHEAQRQKQMNSSPSVQMETAATTSDKVSHASHYEANSEQTKGSSQICDHPGGTTNADPRRQNNDECEDVEITLPLSSKIRLLDVGSCYNPFLCFDEFDPLGIDLSPAKPSVLKCDFLQLSIPALPLPHHPLAFDLHTVSSPLQQLPRCSFHVVVFSLLLEYLPSPVQRWHCCVKAHSLLAVNGLLLIVTPDSHRQHRNAPMMKSWRQALESLGFQRWKYEKKDHIHCLAFRKLRERQTTAGSGRNSEDESSVEHMLYIPQDFNDSCYDDVEKERLPDPEDARASEEFVLSTASELPMFDLDDS